MIDEKEDAPKTDRFANARAAKAAKAAAAKDEARATYGKVLPIKPARHKPPPPPAAAKKWTIGPAAVRQLPPPGEYDARISDIALHDKPDVLWMTVKYELTGQYEGNVPEAEFAAIAAAPGSPNEKRVPEGARLLYRTATAAGVELPPDLDPDRLPELLEGKEVRLRIAHKTIDGVPALIVRRAMPKKVA